MKNKVLKANYGSDKTPLIIETVNGSINIPCYVLEDGKAVLSLNGMQKAIGYKKGTSGMALKTLIERKNIIPFVSEKLLKDIQNPIEFIRPSSGGSVPKTYGYEADVLIDLCYVLIDAKNSGLLKSESQLSLAIQAERITRAFSKTGIVAVIYKLTGYLDDKVKTILNDIFNKFLLEEAKQYRVTFPIELYKQWFKLNNWEWKPENAQRKPGVIGNWTNNLIYARLAPGLLKELKIRNPKTDKGYRKHKYFQFLTEEIGEPKLIEFFGGLIALSKATTSWRKYIEMVNRAYPKYDETLFIPFEYNEEQ